MKDFLINRFDYSRPAIAYKNGNGYWKNIPGKVVGEEINLVYGGRRYIFQYEGELVNHVGAKVSDYKDREMYIFERDIEFI